MRAMSALANIHVVAAAAVLLGLLPPTLAVVGPTTTEVGLLALRRPVLAMLLGAGTPAVWPTRAFEYKNIAELLHRQTDSLMLPELRRPFAITIVALQYIVACAAVGNVAHATYQLCVFTMCSFAPETQFLPALWTVLAIVVHLCGSYAVALRTRLHFVGLCGARNFWGILHDEVQLCAQQPGAKLSFRRESYLFVLMSWITSTGTMLHITFGTVVFSSMLFIGTGDAVIIVLRFIVSAAICRMILMFEISGMRQSIDIPDAVSSKGTGETEGLIQGNA